MAMTKAETCAFMRSIQIARKQARIRQYVALLEQRPQLPDKAAARRLGVSKATIGRYRRGLAGHGLPA